MFEWWRGEGGPPNSTVLITDLTCLSCSDDLTGKPRISLAYTGRVLDLVCG